MKCSKADTIHKSWHLPAFRFEDRWLAFFSGLILFQHLFALIGLREKLRLCFRHINVQSIFGHGRIVLLLIVHFLLGYRQLRELRFYSDDPVVQRVVGLMRLPDVATSRFAEGTAIGFNRKKKGSAVTTRCSVPSPRPAQVFDALHRSGNVHDANGDEAFIRQCIEQVQRALPGVRIETRMDGAFFSQTIVQMLEVLGVEYTLSVPCERLMTLKQTVEQRKRWPSITPDCDAFDMCWKPKSWARRHRFIIRKRFKAALSDDFRQQVIFG